MLLTLLINDATTQRGQTEAGEATLEHRHFNQGGILRGYNIYNYLFLCTVLSYHQLLLNLNLKRDKESVATSKFFRLCCVLSEKRLRRVGRLSTL